MRQRNLGRSRCLNEHLHDRTRGTRLRILRARALFACDSSARDSSTCSSRAPDAGTIEQLCKLLREDWTRRGRAGGQPDQRLPDRVCPFCKGAETESAFHDRFRSKAGAKPRAGSESLMSKRLRESWTCPPEGSVCEGPSRLKERSALFRPDPSPFRRALSLHRLSPIMDAARSVVSGSGGFSRQSSQLRWELLLF
jgi:hypothetical protein